MATSRRDVELVIRAKDEAGKAVDAISKAINGLVDSQDKLEQSAGKSEGALGKLGKSLADLSGKLKGLEVSAAIAQEFDRASAAADRLESGLAQTAKEVDRLGQESKEAAAEVAKLTEAQQRASAEVEKQSQSLRKAKAAQTELNGELRRSVGDRDKLIRAEQRISAALQQQEQRLDNAKAKYADLARQLQLTINPTETFQNRVTAAATAVEKQSGRFEKLKSELASTRTAIQSTTDSVDRLTQRSAAANQAVEKQGAALQQARTGYDAIRVASRAAAENQKRLEDSTSKTAGVLDRQKSALERTRNEMGQLRAAAGQAAQGMQQLVGAAGGQLQGAFDQQRRAMLEVKRTWAELTNEAKILQTTFTAIGPPTRQQAADFNRLTTSARAAKSEYQTQRAALHQMGQAMQQAGSSVEGLRAATQRFGQIQASAGQSIARIRTEATQSVAAYDRLTQAANQAASATQRVGSRGATPPVGPVNSLADAYRRLYGESRQAMSWTQRLRGEVLSLVTAYAGIYGVIGMVRETVSAFMALEAIQNRLNVIFDNDYEKAGVEIDFLRRNADRLGISLSVLGQEYSKFAVATNVAGFSLEATRKIFLSVAEAGRVNKLSMEQMSGIFLALEQMISKGKITSEELRRQLGDRLPGAFQIMASALGYTTAELDEAMKKGEVFSNQDNMLKFADEMSSRFGGALPEALKSTTTELGRFQNEVFKAFLVIGGGGAIEAFTELLRSMNTELSSPAGIAGLQKLGAVLGFLIDVVRVAIENWQGLVFALSLIVGIKAVPVVAALYSGLKTLAIGAKASVVAMTATAGAATSLAVGVRSASGAVGLLTMAINGLKSATGLGLLITGLSLAFSYWVTSATEATEALVGYQKALDAVRNSYDAAGGDQEKFAQGLKSVDVAGANSTLQRLQKQAEDTRDAIRDAVIGTPSSATNPVFVQTQKLIDAFKAGEMSAVDFRDGINAIAEANPQFSQNLLAPLTEAANTIIETEDQVAKLEATLQLLKDPTDRAAAAVIGLGAAMDDTVDPTQAGRDALNTYKEAVIELKKLVPELADELKKLEAIEAIDNAYQQALGAARTIGQVNQAWELRNAALQNLDAEQFKNAGSALSSFTDGLEASAALLRKSEGFRATPYWDVNAYRVGYGSDTITLADGTIQKVTQGMRVSVADANRDLTRRIQEFQNGIMGKIGAGAFNAFTPQQQAALTSIAYNYGSLPDRIAKVIREGGGQSEIAAAIRGLANDRPYNKAGKPVNYNRRMEEAAIFGGSEQIDAAARRQEQADAKAIADGEKKAEQQRQFLEGQQQAIENQEFELANNKQALLDREISKALREAELAYQKAGVEFTDADRQKIIEVTTAKYAEAAAQEEINAKKKEAEDAERRVNELLAIRTQLEQQLKMFQDEGNNEKVTETKEELERVNEQLIAAIANAEAMWAAVGGGAADVAIAKLKTASMEAANFNQQAKQNYIDWSRVGQMFASGLTNAFDKFAQAVANGEDVGKAAKEAFLQFAADFLRQIAQMIIQQAILNALQGFMGGGGLFGGLLRHTGGMVGRGGVSRQVNPAIFNGAARYHDGGIAGLRPGEVPTILKMGEEVLTGDDPRHVMNGGKGGGGNNRMKIVNAIDAPSMLDAALQSDVGEKVFINFVRANAGAIREVLG